MQGPRFFRLCVSDFLEGLRQSLCSYEMLCGLEGHACPADSVLRISGSRCSSNEKIKKYRNFVRRQERDWAVNLRKLSVGLVFMSRYQNAGQNTHSLKRANKSFENITTSNIWE